MPCNESWIYCFDTEIKRQSSQWKHARSPWPKMARHSKSTHKLLMIPFFSQLWHELHALGSCWTDSQQGILRWGYKGVQEVLPKEEASTLQIQSVAFPPGQCTSPQLYPCHRLFDQDGHQDSSLWRCPWCSRYRRRKWTRRYEFKSWTRLIAFHIALIPLGKVWIQ